MTDPSDLVSIVVPCFNAERWLPACLDSALSQTHANTEIIVVDDGSTDDSAGIAAAYSARIGPDKVRVFTGGNAGPSAARNRGLLLAKGGHVQFLDSDDLLLPRKIADGLEAAREGIIPFSGLLPFGNNSSARLAGIAERLRAPKPLFDPTKPIVSALRFEIQTSQPLFPTALLRVVGGFRAEMRWLEDIDLNLRLVLKGARYEPIASVGVLLRDHSTPGRQRLAKGAALGRLMGERAMMDAVRDANAFNHEIAVTFADRLAYAGRQAYLAGEIDAACDAFILARSLAPHPRPTRIPLYNALSATLGLERTERLVGAIRRQR